MPCCAKIDLLIFIYKSLAKITFSCKIGELIKNTYMATKNTEKAVKSEFAVIKTGGKQYLVRVGDIIDIEKLPEEAVKDNKISFDEVLLMNDEKSTRVGAPTVSGAKVSAELVKSFREKKVIVIKYKQKSRYFKKNGHRQPKMKIQITAIK